MKIKRNWKQELIEYSELHNKDCCVNTKHGCDVGTALRYFYGKGDVVIL